MKYLIFLFFPLQLLAQQRSIIFKNVNVVDVVKGSLIKNQNVLIEGERITKISSKPIVSNSAIVITATGKYLIPGLCDFNAEVFNYEHSGVPAFNLLLANGVTSVRDLKPQENPVDVFDARKRLRTGNILAPRIYLSGKTLIDRLPFQKENMEKSLLVNSVAEAQQAVDSMIFYGADVIDIRTILNRPILQAITKRAHQKGKKVLARFSGNWIDASEDGVDAFTHPADLWRVASKGRDKLFRFSEADSMRFVSVPEFYNRVLPSLGPVDTTYFYILVNKLVKNHTWICTNFASHMPSKVKFEIGDSSRNEYRTAAQKKQLLLLKEEMNQIVAERSKIASPQVYFAIMANKKGVPILAGTQIEDVGTPGMSLHDELYWFVVGGLSPAEALRTATINPAVFLNMQKDLGTIDKGKLADLVLLDENPLEDISNTRKINIVVVNGKLLQKEDLNKLLLEAKERVNLK
ncbi:MAG TPA: amidohydrolase family protein [Flavisolibacter sp.]|jgi:hypothetical protein|nr:amidohydrolase family protein [Flavisolibacter sp.]